MKTPSRKTATEVFKTWHEYFCPFQTSFLVMKDGEEAIGIKSQGRNCLRSEQIRGNSSVTFGSRSGQIHTLCYVESSKSLFVGGEDRRVVEYQKSERFDSWEKRRDLGDLGVGRVLSSAVYGNLAFFGGDDLGFRVVDSGTTEAIGHVFETAFSSVNTLMVCEVSRSEVYLFAGGRVSFESFPESSDLLSIGLLCRRFRRLHEKTSFGFGQPVPPEVQDQIDSKDETIEHQRRRLKILRESLALQRQKRQGTYVFDERAPGPVGSEHF